MPQYSAKLVELLSATVNPTSRRTVEGFSSLHPIMRMREWIDRRLSRRARVNLPAIVNFNGQTLSATVIDLSPTGAGITGVKELRTGDLIVISSDALRPLNSEVVWVSGDRAGVKFVKAN